MRIKTTITHPGDQKSNGDVRTGNFPDIDPHLQILDEYFSTFFRVFDNSFMIIREFDSNYEILDNNWRF